MRQLLSKRKVYTRLFLFYCFIALVGLISNSLLLALLIFTVALLLWHYHHLFLMDKWLWRDRKLSPPISEGIWGHLFEGIYYLQRRDRREAIGRCVKVGAVASVLRGTGGTEGAAYLASTLTKRCFPELWSLRTLL